MLLSIGLHNHQPVGNFDHVIEKNYLTAYLPFLKVLRKFRKVRVNLHYSGYLLEWLESNGQEALEIVSELVSQRRAELKTGGFYEPILSIIPPRDRVGQIELLTEKLKSLFGVRPVGAWLAERVWEQCLVNDLHQAGVVYTVLDDYQLLASGAEPKKMCGYFTTENCGQRIYIFPISKALRYMVPFRRPSTLMAYLKKLASRFEGEENPALVVLDDDGEKFGAWPETFEWVYANGWLEAFLELLEANSSWLQTICLADALDLKAPEGLIYINNSSYPEMMSWSQGYFRRYLTRYPVANMMHKKMLWTSELVNKAASQEARRSLYRGQCNDAYWHGIFGGHYLPHLRAAVFRNLIEAEVLARSEQLRKGSGADQTCAGPARRPPSKTNGPAIERYDFDLDGMDEIEVRSKEIKMMLSPAKGASIVELDFFPLRLNLASVPPRTKEPYHEKLLRQELASQQAQSARFSRPRTIHERTHEIPKHIADSLWFDKGHRSMFSDLVTARAIGVEDLFRACEEGIERLNNKSYDCTTFGPEDCKLTFRHKGALNLSSRQNEKAHVEFSKSITLRPSEPQIQVAYSALPKDLPLSLFTEIPISLASHKDAASGVFGPRGNTLASLDAKKELLDLEAITIIDAPLRLKIRISRERLCGFWTYPIMTVCRSEEGFELIFQGIVVVLPSVEGDLIRLELCELSE